MKARITGYTGRFLIYFLISNVLICAVNKPNQFSLKEADIQKKVWLAEDALNMLRHNGFVVIPGDEKEVYDVYLDCKKNNHPIFITTDAVLHTAHIFFDSVLRILEVEKLSDYIEELTDRMLDVSQNQYDEASDRQVKKAALLNIGFFSVAKKMLDPDYEPGFQLEDFVDREVNNISKHEGIKFRELLTYIENPSLFVHPYGYEDYSQYIPRGHYSRNEVFNKYFKVMMWYGRIDFKLKPGKSEEAVLHGRKMTLQALLMVDALMRDQRAFELWKRAYQPTVYFVGKTDDLNVKDYMSLIKEVFSSNKNIDKYNNGELLSEFIRMAFTLRPPKILSGASFQEDGAFEQTSLGFRFMGQRFIPDSYIFQNLVFGKENLRYLGNGKPFTMEMIPNRGPARAFPRGLDVCAVLGSQRALDIMEKEGDTEYEGYYEQLARLKKEFATATEMDWKQNLYWRWLYAFLPLLRDQDRDRVPEFMKSPFWKDKELNTVLGSWTELRHDTILYAKQSYTMMGRAPMPKPTLTYGFVEPYPEVYKRIMDMMIQLKELNTVLEIDIPEVQDRLGAFICVLEKLKTISEKELSKKPLTNEDTSFIWNSGSTFKGLSVLPESLKERITSDTDFRMDIIADVHTDPNTRQVLEEGVGAPFHIYVIIEDKAGVHWAHGAVFSYYEFKHPLSDRLTDEKWQKMGESAQRPPLPEWTQKFIAVSQAAQKMSLAFYTCNPRIHKQRVSH